MIDCWPEVHLKNSVPVTQTFQDLRNSESPILAVSPFDIPDYINDRVVAGSVAVLALLPHIQEYYLDSWLHAIFAVTLGIQATLPVYLDLLQTNAYFLMIGIPLIHWMFDNIDHSRTHMQDENSGIIRHTLRRLIDRGRLRPPSASTSDLELLQPWLGQLPPLLEPPP